MGVMLEDGYLHHAAVKKNVSRGGNFVCNVLTNVLNILTPAVFMPPTTLCQTRLGEDIFKLIGKSLNLCGFLTDCIAYCGTNIRHCFILLGEGILFFFDFFCISEALNPYSSLKISNTYQPDFQVLFENFLLFLGKLSVVNCPLNQWSNGFVMFVGQFPRCLYARMSHHRLFLY